MQVLPGKDAYLMSAMLGYIIQNGLENKAFIAEHTVGFEAIKPHFDQIPVAEYAKISGVAEELIIEVAKEITSAKTFALH